MCTHAYAVSKASAGRLVRILRHPLFAYSRPLGKPKIYNARIPLKIQVDHAFVHLNSNKKIKQYSIYPPVVVQSKSSLSDVSAGTGPDEDFYLMDSALERVKLWEEQQIMNPAV